MDGAMDALIRELVLTIIQIFYFILLGRIILSFFRAATYTNPNPTVEQISQVLYQLTEPLLRPLRNLIPSVKMGMGYLDLSPLLLLIILSIIRNVLIVHW